MIEVDAAMVAIFVSLLLSLLGLAAAWGKISERVSQNKKDISDNQESLQKDISKLHSENRDDHNNIFSSLNEIKEKMYKRNGRVNDD